MMNGGLCVCVRGHAHLSFKPLGGIKSLTTYVYFLRKGEISSFCSRNKRSPGNPCFPGRKSRATTCSRG